MNNKQMVSEICDFVAYVDSFYNENTGVYPIMGMTTEMITIAIKTYIEGLDDSHTWGGGDSLDRERVRDIMLDQNSNLVFSH